MTSTTGRYIPGVGRTITRANIRRVIEAQAEAKQPPIEEAEAMARELVGKCVQSRHVARAARLMHGGT